MYQAIGNHLAKTMRSCFGKTDKPQTDPFVVLADVDNGGTARSIEVRPRTNIAVCFAEGIASAPFPKPPAFPDPLMWGLVMLAVALRGGGPYSLDRKLGREL